MNVDHADLAALTRRLADIPAEFLGEPSVAGRGEMAVAAIVGDVLRMHGLQASGELLAGFQGRSAHADRNRLALAAVACWLLADEALIAADLPHPALEEVVGALVAEMAAITPAHAFVHDAERREELVRALLARLGLRPLGETPAQAQDRLSAISAIQRRALLAASRQAEKRAREVREALARKLAEESADKWTRE